MMYLFLLFLNPINLFLFLIVLKFQWMCLRVNFILITFLCFVFLIDSKLVITDFFFYYFVLRLISCLSVICVHERRYAS